MTIIVGTDFSVPATAASLVAVELAKALKHPLVLVHATPAKSASLEGKTRAASEELSAQSGWPVDFAVVDGAPEAALPALAATSKAALVIIAGQSSKPKQPWLLGSVAERVVQTTLTPVLAVREPESILAWLRAEHELRVTVGVERTALAHRALSWANWLQRAGQVQVTAVQIAWPAEARLKAAKQTPVALDRFAPELEDTLLSELAEWAGALRARVALAVRPGWGRVDAHLLQVAVELQADVLVVGTNQREALARIWQGSVSRAVLGQAPMNVVCVPPFVTPADEISSAAPR